MKRIYSLLLLVVFSLMVANIVHAQSTMTDQQIMDFYVKAKSDGRSVAQIVTQLMERGVTVERIRRIRRNYESQQKKEVVGAENISGISGKTVERLRKGKKVESPQKNREFPQRESDKTNRKGLSPYAREEGGPEDQSLRARHL